MNKELLLDSLSCLSLETLTEHIERKERLAKKRLARVNLKLISVAAAVVILIALTTMLPSFFEVNDIKEYHYLKDIPMCSYEELSDIRLTTNSDNSQNHYISQTMSENELNSFLGISDTYILEFNTEFKLCQAHIIYDSSHNAVHAVIEYSSYDDLIIKINVYSEANENSLASIPSTKANGYNVSKTIYDDDQSNGMIIIIMQKKQTGITIRGNTDSIEAIEAIYNCMINAKLDFQPLNDRFICK